MNFLRIKNVVQKTGLSKSTIYRLMKLGQFPGGIKLTAKTIGWLESEIDDWIAAALETRRGK